MFHFLIRWRIYILGGALMTFLVQGVDAQNDKDTYPLSSSNDTTLISLYLRLSDSYFYEKGSVSIKYAEEALRLSQLHNLPLYEVEARFALANIQQYTEPVIAHQHLMEGQKQARSLNNIPLLLDAMKKLAFFHLKWEQYEEASNYAQEMLEIGNKYPVEDMEGIYATLGEIYAHQKKVKKAINHYQKVLDARMETEEGKKLAAGTLSDMGNVYYKVEKYDSARNYYMRGIEISQSFKDHRSLGFLKDNVGLTLQREGKLYKALQWQKEALFHRRVVGSQLGIITSLNNTADTYVKLNKPDSALIFAKESYPMCLKMNRLLYLEEVVVTLSEAFSELNMLDSAYFYMKMAYGYREMRNDKDREQALAGAAPQIEMEEQLFQNKLLEVQNQALLTAGILLSLALIAILILAWMFGRQSMMRKKLLLQLQEVNETKDKLFSIIAHDLRGPINSLKSMLDLLVKRMISQDEFNDFSGRLHHDVTTVHFLLENLLNWSKNQLQGLNTEQESVGLREAAGLQLEVFQSFAEEKNISFENAIPENLVITGDQNHLALIFRNLVSNAIKFTRNGGRIKLDAERSANENTVYFSVSDNGVGMTKENFEKLFIEKSSFTTRGVNGEKGTGLGLLLVKEMVEKNQGRIWVESKLGEGSIFHVVLPEASPQPTLVEGMV